MATGFINASDPGVLSRFDLLFGDPAEHTLAVVTDAEDRGEAGVTFPVTSIRLRINVQGWVFYGINGVPVAENWEVVSLFRTESTTNSDLVGFALRNVAGSMYVFNHGTGTNTRVRRRSPYGTFRESINETTSGANNDQFSWMRARVNGSTLQLKRWHADEPEPAAWLWTGTNTNNTGAGGIALAAFHAPRTNEVINVGWATDGDTAPTGPVGPSERRRSPLLLTPW